MPLRHVLFPHLHLDGTSTTPASTKGTYWYWYYHVRTCWYHPILQLYDVSLIPCLLIGINHHITLMDSISALHACFLLKCVLQQTQVHIIVHIVQHINMTMCICFFTNKAVITSFYVNKNSQSNKKPVKPHFNQSFIDRLF